MLYRTAQSFWACLALALLLAVPARGDAQEQAERPVAARDLPRGATLTEADIHYLPSEGEMGSGTPWPGPGWVTRRVISRGEPLQEPALGRPRLVRAGDEVDVIWRGGAIELRLRGTAMGAASEGERVTVRIDTRRRLDGIAAGPGVVHINRESK